MGNLPTAEENRHFDSLASLNKLTNAAHLMLNVMWVGPGAHLHFFNFEHRVFFRAVRFLFLLVAKLSVIHHAADWRLRVRRNFHQIHLLRLHLFQRFVQRHDAQLLALRPNDANFTGANLMIDPRFSSDKPPPSVVRRSYSYASPFSCASSDFNRCMKSTKDIGARFSPPLRRGATVWALTSLSPITSAYGILANWASRIL